MLLIMHSLDIIDFFRQEQLNLKDKYVIQRQKTSYEILVVAIIIIRTNKYLEDYLTTSLARSS